MTTPREIQAPATAATGMPLFRLGFRPFYLGGAIFGLVAVALWLAVLRGMPLSGQPVAMSSVVWHVHEMVFGFTAAIVTGFLLTAVRAWTGLDTPHGVPLALLWLLWIAGRVSVWTGPSLIGAIVDAAFLPVVAGVLWRVLHAAGNRRNLFLAAAVGAWGGLNILFQWWVWHGRPDLALRTGDAAVGVVVMFITVIAGRVIPMFTMNAIPGLTMKRWTPVEKLAAPIALLTFLVDAAHGRPWLVAALAGASALVHGARIVGWRSWRVGRRPILSILHVAYAWLPAGFVLLALSAVNAVAHSIAMHAFTTGAIGCAIIAMITRTALGHTGRRLIAGTAEVWSYRLMLAAALLRVGGPWFAGRWANLWWDAAGACWCLALAIYVGVYGRYLGQARIDGKMG